MPHAPVNDAGAVIYYEDSGKPGTLSAYTTIVIIHGLVFHSGSFIPLLKYASAHNTRVICLDLRDNPGSSPYTPAETELLWSNEPEKEKRGLRLLGLDIAAFLKNIITAEDLPAIQEVDGKKTGGIVLVSWSLGNIWSLAMFANEEIFDGETRAVLQRSLRTLVMYEPPHFALGIIPPEEIYYPGYDRSFSPDQVPMAFANWVGNFHSSLPELSDDAHAHSSRPNLQHTSTDPQFVSSIQQMSSDELKACTELSVLERSCRDLNAWKVQGAYHNAEKVLFDLDPHSGFPDLDVVFLWGDMTIPLCSFVAAYTKKRLEDSAAEGKTTRSTKFVKIRGGNHFIHWHEPERFIETILSNID